jgi:4-diphosphocytidyl-2-C-methyl-D-erythritol kinase
MVSGVSRVNPSSEKIVGVGTCTRGWITIITDFPDQQIVFAYGRNDLQAVAERKYGEIARALAWLRQFSPLARMTGSGACVFAPFDNVEHAQAVADQVPSEWEGRCAAGLTHHPLARFAV